MLQKIRESTQGIVSKILVGLLIAVFALWGVDRIAGNFIQSTPTLTVNGDEIQSLEIDKLVQSKTQEMLAKLGKDADPSKIDESQLRVAAVNELIQRKLLEQAAQANGMDVSVKAVDRRISQNPDFQIDGTYNAKRAAQVIQGAGYTPNSYRATLKQEIQLNQQLAAFTATGFSTPDQLARLAALVHQKRSMRYFVINTASFTDSVKVTDQEIQDYYQQHQSQFQQEEQVSIEYVELDKTKVMDEVTVTEDQVKAAYQDEVAAYKAQTERRASHILWPATTPEELAAARKEATAVKAKLDAGADFAKMAEQYSKDTGSAKNGGDVGFTTGSSFDDKFEEALRGLSLNQVSDPVQTQFGIHLIKLTEMNETKVQPYEARKEALTHDLKQKAADTLYKSRLDELKTLAFESPDLSEPATRLKLVKQTSDLFSRTGGVGITANADVKKAAFAPEVLDQGLNSEVISLDADHSVVLRLKDHQSAQVRPLEVVRGEVEVILRQRKATEQAKTLGESLVGSMNKGDNIDGLLLLQMLAWAKLDNVERVAANVNPEITDKAFTMPAPAAGKTLVNGFALRNGDYAVVELEKVTDGTMADMKDEEAQNMRNFLSQQSGANDITAYVQGLEASAKVKGRESQLAVKDPLL